MFSNHQASARPCIFAPGKTHGPGTYARVVHFLKADRAFCLTAKLHVFMFACAGKSPILNPFSIPFSPNSFLTL